LDPPVQLSALEPVPVPLAHSVRVVPAAARPELARVRQVRPEPAQEPQARPERERAGRPEGLLVQVAVADPARVAVARVALALMVVEASAAAVVAVAVAVVAANSRSGAPNLRRRRM